MAERVEVKELDRDEIIQVINAAGLMGPDELLREINDQVVGRAGLAVMLAEACLSGEPFEVATGRRLLASGGTIDWVNTWHTEGPRRLILQPRSLRAAAVDDTFFGEPGSVDVQDATDHLPDQSSIGRVLTKAALRGAQIPRETIRRNLALGDRESIIGYSLLGAYELREAVRLAPQHAVAIATAAYNEGVGSSFALRVLVDHASSPNGPLDKDSWDLLQMIAQRLHGRRGTIADRRLVIEVTDQWLTEGGNLEVGACALKHALHQGFDDSSLVPRFGDTVQIVRGIQAPEVVAQIASLWNEVPKLSHSIGRCRSIH